MNIPPPQKRDLIDDLLNPLLTDGSNQGAPYGTMSESASSAAHRSTALTESTWFTPVSPSARTFAVAAYDLAFWGFAARSAWLLSLSEPEKQDEALWMLYVSAVMRAAKLVGLAWCYFTAPIDYRDKITPPLIHPDSFSALSNNLSNIQHLYYIFCFVLILLYGINTTNPRVSSCIGNGWNAIDGLSFFVPLMNLACAKRIMALNRQNEWGGFNDDMSSISALVMFIGMTINSTMLARSLQSSHQYDEDDFRLFSLSMCVGAAEASLLLLSLLLNKLPQMNTEYHNSIACKPSFNSKTLFFPARALIKSFQYHAEQALREAPAALIARIVVGEKKLTFQIENDGKIISQQYFKLTFNEDNKQFVITTSDSDDLEAVISRCFFSSFSDDTVIEWMQGELQDHHQQKILSFKRADHQQKIFTLDNSSEIFKEGKKRIELVILQAGNKEKYVTAKKIDLKDQWRGLARGVLTGLEERGKSVNVNYINPSASLSELFFIILDEYKLGGHDERSTCTIV